MPIAAPSEIVSRLQPSEPSRGWIKTLGAPRVPAAISRTAKMRAATTKA
jgi:hypothetical protein